MNPAIRIGAPAKINLYLHVHGRRPDGYHELDSLVVFAGLHDVVSVASSLHGVEFAIEGPNAATLSAVLGGADDIVVRAAKLLASHLGRAPQVAIRLHKTIPVSAGLGGGSADAAAVLLALCRLWQVELPASQLASLALRIGADLPVCLASRTSFMSGLGDRIEAAPEVPPLGIVLVNPGVALATPTVFKALDGHFETLPRPRFAPNDTASLIAALKDCRNDLTEPAMTLAPVIGEMLAALAETEGAMLSRMSGSGATCFALYADVGTAEAAAKGIAAAHADWWVAASHLIRARDDLSVA